MLDSTRRQSGTAPPGANVYATQSDMKALVRDARDTLSAAASMTGEKAEEMRGRAMELLDRALGKGREYQGQAIVKGKELAHTADVYVKDNPWRTVALAAGVGLLAGMLLRRK